MNALIGDIYLDTDFPMRNGSRKSIYLVVVADAPYTEDSVLFAMANVLPEQTDSEGTNWDWPECFRLPAKRTPLNSDMEIYIDDVYQGSRAALTSRCEHLGQLDAMVSCDLLRNLSNCTGIAGVHCNRFLQLAEQIGQNASPPPMRRR